MSVDMHRMRAAITTPPFSRTARHPYQCVGCGKPCDYRYACRLLDGRNGRPLCTGCRVTMPSERTVRFAILVGDEPQPGASVGVVTTEHQRESRTRAAWNARMRNARHQGCSLDRGCLICRRVAETGKAGAHV